MKKLWIAAVILAMMLAAALYNTRTLGIRTRTLAGLLTEAEACVRAEDLPAALRLTTNAREKWESWLPYLYVVIHHAEADSISEQFLIVEQYLHFPREADEYAAANAVLIERIDTLYEMERLSLRNLF